MRRVKRLTAARVLPIVLVAVLGAAAAVVAFPASIAAAPITPFGARFQTNDNGAITTIGNNLETCPASDARCPDARTGKAKLNNNSFVMTYIDADGDPATVNSSSAQLTLPSGGRVLWAGLYWGARVSAGTGGHAGSGTRTAMSFKVPGAAAYSTVTSQAEFGPTSGDLAYQQFADVTTAVRAAGPGTYWGADVVAGTGEDRYAGWSLTVVFRSPDLPLRNLTVFDGFTDVGQGNPQTITVNGFLAPLTGAVDAQLGMVAYEGDYSASGDTATLNTTQLGTTLSPGTNFFNSTNDDNGTSVTARTPADLNMLGFDIKNLGAPGVIPNGATSATLRFTSTGDRYFPGVVTTSINLYAPDFTPSTKTVVDLDGHDPAVPGDTLQYTLNYLNVGEDPAASLVMTDPLPPNTGYVPGSLRVVTGANPGAKTDAPGDDQAEFLAGTRQVRFRLGSGATAATGGSLVPQASTSVSYKVTLDAASGGTTVTNTARLDYVAQTTGLPFSYDVRPVSTPVSEQADLALTKSATPDPVVAGGAVTTTLTVVNHGPSPARNVVVTDPLPAGETVTAPTSTQGSCGVAAATVTCTLGALAVGATATMTLPGHIDAASAEASISNVATVTSDSPDPDPSNDTAGATVALTRSADLSVTKSATPATVVPGDSVTFTVVATNHGLSDAVNVDVTDLVADPGRLSLVSATAPGATCTVSGPGAQCTLARLAVGASLPVTITGVLAPDVAAGTTVDDTATVASATPDDVPANNRSTAAVTAAAPQADVVLAKLAPVTAVAGRPIAYRLTAVNHGPSDAAGVVVTDTLPAGITPVTAASSRGTCSIAGQTVTCAVATLVTGASARIVIEASVDPAHAAGPVTNTATVTAATADPVPANNSASATSTIGGRADLQVTKTGTSPVVAGGTITYAVTVVNNGPSTAHAVTLSDALPPEFTFASASATCAVPSGGALSCALGDLAVGGNAVVTVVMDVPPGYAGAPATETATASSSTTDPDHTNDTASWTTNGAAAVADLALTKIASPEPAVAGGLLTYTVSARNLGPSDATNVVITDTMPAGVSVVSAPGCSLAGPAVTCAVGTLANGATANVTIQVRVDATLADATVLANSATVTSDTQDASAANNTDTVTSTVTTVADLRVAKSAAPGSGPAGSAQTFTVTIDNAGPSTAREVTFTDHFPPDAGLVGGLAGITGATCTAVSGDLECTVGDLAPGATATVTVPVLLASYDAPGSYDNTVTASTTTTDTDLVNNTAVAPVTITAPVTDVALTKTALSPPFVAGAAFGYEIQATVREAPDLSYGSDAQGVVITDVVPAGLTALTATSTQGVCTISGSTVTCTVGTMAGPVTATPPAPVTITITGTVAPGLSVGTVHNAATAETTTTDAVPANNSAGIDTVVQAQADLSVSKTADADPLVAGGEAGYTVGITNAGPSDALGVIVTDTVPAGVTFDAAASDPTCTAVAGTVTCAVGTVASGETVTVRIVGHLDPSAPAGTLANTAHATSDVTDPDPANNSATVSTEVVRSADLQMIKTSDTATPAVGDRYTYAIAITNAGPSTATDATGTDVLPPGVRLVSISPTGGACTSTSGVSVTVRCSAAVLPAGFAATILLTVELPDGMRPGRLDNTATASSTTPDPDLANNTSTAGVDVQVVADTSVTKTLVTHPVVASRPVTYQLTARNAGPATAPDVVISDTLPKGVTLAGVQVQQGSGSCVAVTQEGNTVVDCPVGALAVGGTATVLVMLDAAASLTGVLANTAYVGSGALDPAIADNTSTVTAEVHGVSAVRSGRRPGHHPSGQGGRNLSATGFGAADVCAFAVLLLAAGAVSILAGRRRRVS